MDLQVQGSGLHAFVISFAAFRKKIQGVEVYNGLH